MSIDIIGDDSNKGKQNDILIQEQKAISVHSLTTSSTDPKS